MTETIFGKFAPEYWASFWGANVKRFAIAVLISFAGTSAFASDMAVKPPPPRPVLASSNWSGFYLGGNLGYGTTHTCYDALGFVAAPIAPVTNYCGGANGVFAGGQAGYRWKISNWVFGLEAQGDYAGLKGIIPTNPAIQANTLIGLNSARIDSFGLFTGQFGYAWQNALLYVKGGAAVVHDQYAALFPNFSLVGAASDVRWGGAIGAGVEFGLTPNWTIGVEYDHAFLGGSKDLAFTGGAPIAGPRVVLLPGVPFQRVSENLDMAMVRLNYRFGGSAALLSAPVTNMPVKALPQPPQTVANWTGFYLGINGGAGWGTTGHTDLFGVTTGTFGTNGGVVGVTYGGNWQTGQFVIGFEGDFDYANLKGSFTSAAFCSINGGTTCFSNLSNLGTDRVRVGVDVGGWLLYGTGGVGYADVNAGQTPCGVSVIFQGNSCHSQGRTGWVAGAGVEKMFASQWSAKLEWLHYDFGNVINYTPTLIGGGNSVFVLERGNLIRAGVNYKFDWLPTPLIAKY